MKQKKNLTLLILFCLVFLTAFVAVGKNIMANKTITNNSDTMFFIKTDYEKMWKEVEKFEDLNQPKSALNIVNDIRSKARREKNEVQLIKTYIYSLDLINQTTDNNEFYKELTQMEKEIETMSFPASAVLNSVVGEFYLTYCKVNKYRNRNRSEVLNSENQDISTWSNEQLSKKAEEYFLNSIANRTKLIQTPISDFKDILLFNNDNNYTTTLYDFLAWRVINTYYLNNCNYLEKFSDDFSASHPELLDDAEIFANFKLKEPKEKCVNYQIITILQSIISAHLSEKNSNALIDADLNRLKILLDIYVGNDKDKLYLQQLYKMLDKYSDNPEVAWVYHGIASKYNDLARKYDSQNPTTEIYKDYYVKADEICKIACEKYPKQNAAQGLKSISDLINQKHLSITCANEEPSEAPFLINLEYKNVKEAFVKIVKISEDEFFNYFDYIPKLKENAVIEFSQSLIDNGDHRNLTSELKVDGLKNGFYLIFVSDNKDFSASNGLHLNCKKIQITRFAVVEDIDNNKNLYKIKVVDFKTGEPIEGANVQLLKKITTSQCEGITNKNGDVEFNYKEYSHFYIKVTKDSESYISDKNYNNSIYISENYHRDINIFTDRAIYRPGQTIYFKILNYCLSDKKTANVIPNEKLKIYFRDVNYQEISTLEVTTNEFGTAAGQFSIPQDRLNGKMYICVDGYSNNKRIQVEEYKRPTFEVTLKSPTSEFAINEVVKLSGEAQNYSGVKVSNAKVHYIVKRVPRWRGWKYWYWNLNEEVVADTNVVTDDNGIFNVEFVAKPDKTIPEDDNITFSYNITAYVTDINGETRSATQNISIGYKTLFINALSSKEIVIKNNNNLNNWGFSCTNANDNPIDCDVEIKVYSLKSFDKPRLPKKLGTCKNPIYTREKYDVDFGTKVYSETDNNIQYLEKQQLIKQFAINQGEEKNVDLSFINNQKSGNYCVELSAKDNSGKISTSEYRFSLIDKNETTENINRYFWVEPLKENCKLGDTAEIVYGTSFDNVTLFIYVYKDGNLLEKKTIKLNKNNYCFTKEITESLYGGFTVNAFFVKDGEFIASNNNIDVNLDYKDLKINFLTFRDKLQPGESETWKIKITDYKDLPVASEFLATLYDESLDYFVPNIFNLNIYSKNFNYQNFRSIGFNVERGQNFSQNNFVHSNYYIDYIKLNWFGHEYINYSHRRKSVFYSARPSKSARVNTVAFLAKESADADGLADEMDCQSMAAKSIEQENNSIEDFDTKDIKIRENFAETAFFVPQVTTDKNGELYLEFTMPESLTRWKMLGFAHTPDMKFQSIVKHLTTCKKFSVSVNLPRFFRENDNIKIPVKIANLSDENLENGRIKIEILDAETLEPLDNFKVEQNIKNFSVKAGGNVAVDFELNVPLYTQPVVCKVSAICGSFSDGEQKIVPVLTDRILVTESMPINIRGKQSKDFEFTSWKQNNSKTAENHSFTFEFTSNPIWNVVMALPAMQEYPHDCMEQTFTKLYANLVAANIVNSDPKIKETFNTWKNSQSEALVSALEKNQELKSVILQETPWVNDGKNETSQHNKIAKLFDSQFIETQHEKFLTKLTLGQKPNGGWPWFSQMKENIFVTQYIVAGFGKLYKLGICDVKADSKIWSLISKALNYIDSESVIRYQKLKETKQDLKTFTPSYLDIQYLYARSFFIDEKISSEAKSVLDYYLSQLKKNGLKMQNLQMQALSAIIINRYSDGDKVAMQIINSLRENAIESEEMGMYYKSNVKSLFWYNAPIETQATIIEAFNEVSNDKKTVEELKIWLIKNKQTNSWNSTKATVEACNALLSIGKNKLSLDAAQNIEIKVGEQKIDMSNAQAGTGYVKKTWTKDQINKKMADISVKNSNDNIAYGAAYCQYFEKLENINEVSNGVSIKKEFYLKSQNKQGNNELTKVTPKTKIHHGDVVTIRFEIKSDRQMEYVHIKDLRPAGFEPLNVISRYHYQDGLWYYQSTKDASENFFVEYLNKGTYVFEYDIIAVHSGDFSTGMASMQCMYAPEFTCHSNGGRIKVD